MGLLFTYRPPKWWHAIKKWQTNPKGKKNYQWLSWHQFPIMKNLYIYIWLRMLPFWKKKKTKSSIWFRSQYRKTTTLCPFQISHITTCHKVNQKDHWICPLVIEFQNDRKEEIEDEATAHTQQDETVPFHRGSVTMKNNMRWSFNLSILRAIYL